MKRLKENKNVYVFIFYTILLAIIPITLFFSNSVGETMNEHIIDTMENSAELCVEMIEGRYETDMQMIESLAVSDMKHRKKQATIWNVHMICLMAYQKALWVPLIT